MAAHHQHFTGLLCISLFCAIQSEVQGTNEVRVNFPLTKVTLPEDLIFPYFGQKYKSLYISRDGFVSFSEHARYVTSRKFTERDEKKINAAEDYPFVAPFYYGGADLGSTLEGNKPYQGKIFYEILQQKGNANVKQELEKIGRNVTSSIAGVSTFDPIYALVVTWQTVTDQYNTGILKCTDTPGRMCQDNTFQAVLVTNGMQSFAIFNYKEMNIKFPSSTNYQAGFNGGYGKGWSPAIDIGKMKNITQFQASDRTGRFIYQINEERILTGGCDNPDGILEVVPDFDSMLGGRMVEVTGPCFKGGMSYTLTFGSSRKVQSQGCITEDYGNNAMKVQCEVPVLTETGQVPVFMRANNGQLEYKTTLTIVMPDVLPSEDRVQLVNQGQGSRWNDASASSLYLQWDPRVISNHSNAKVSVSLLGYSEERKSWDPIKPLSRNPITVNARQFQFKPDDIDCDERCQSYEIGVIEVKLEDPRMAIKYRTLRSRPTTLAWLVNKGMVAKYGNSWPSEKCKEWHHKDMQNKAWLNYLPACPCNLQQALVDFGRWQKDPGCNMFSKSQDNCVFHTIATHCVRSVNSNTYGAGNQCCYRDDGTLIYSADSYQGSTPDRGHAWGADSPSSMGRVDAVVSHGVHDVVPYYYCCLWSNDCDKYMDLRPTQQCTDYSSPKQAMVYGQGNVRTLDNEDYYVCGEGDFILLQSSPVTIEGRFQRSPFNPNYNSTILTDVGIRAGNDIIEIKMKGPNADRSKRVLEVLVNGKYQFFDNGPLRWKDFSDTTLVNSDDVSNTMESNITVITKDGVGIQVAEKDQRLSLLVMIPPKFSSVGLLGKWNNNTYDDLTPRGDNYPLLDRTPQKIYSHFVYSWAVTKEEGTRTIVPFPVYATNKTDMCSTPQQQTPSCNGDKACNNDYWTTKNMTLAYDTLRMSSLYQSIQQDRQPERSCGLLKVPQSIKSTYNYSLGNTVTLTGCRRGTLEGTKEYTCVAMGEDLNGQAWSPEVSASCGDSDKVNLALIIVPVVAVVVLIAIVVAVILKRRKSKSTKKKEPVKDIQYSTVAQKE